MLLEKQPKKVVYLAALVVAVPAGAIGQELIYGRESGYIMNMVAMALIISVCYLVTYLRRQKNSHVNNGSQKTIF